jgi:hypothetical protein
MGSSVYFLLETDDFSVGHHTALLLLLRLPGGIDRGVIILHQQYCQMHNKHLVKMFISVLFI